MFGASAPAVDPAQANPPTLRIWPTQPCAAPPCTGYGDERTTRNPLAVPSLSTAFAPRLRASSKYGPPPRVAVHSKPSTGVAARPDQPASRFRLSLRSASPNGFWMNSNGVSPGPMLGSREDV